MRKFNYILNDLAFDTLVTKCLYGEPTDEDVKECENQIELLKQENQQLQNKVDKTKMISLQLRTHLSNWLFKEGYMGGERTKKLLDELDEILGGDLNE